MTARPMSPLRFEALLYRRAPWVEFVFEAQEWWSNDAETLLAVVGLDLIDHDFSWAILGRDETGVFRAVDVRTCLPTLEEARTNMQNRLAELSATNAQEFPQGDNDRKKHEILVPCVPVDRLHPHFPYLSNNPHYSPARGLIKELSFAFRDRDGNYRQDFQTTGFDRRLWELYLYAFLYEQRFLIDDEKAIPDFVAEKQGGRVAIEVVTVNATPGVTPPQPKTKEEEFELTAGYMAMKWGSPLVSKLRKKYWEKPHIAGIPFAIAIHDYHGPGTMTWSLHALSEYLFGVRGNVSGKDERIETHTYGTKTIPSGFFRLPEAENVSAVIASNEATLPKFNRMGKIAGFGDLATRMSRFGAQLDLETMTVSGFHTDTKVGVATESWSTGIWIFHNPNAKLPFPVDLVDGALNVFLQDGERHSLSTRRTHVLRSVTHMGSPPPTTAAIGGESPH